MKQNRRESLVELATLLAARNLCGATRTIAAPDLPGALSQVAAIRRKLSLLRGHRKITVGSRRGTAVGNAAIFDRPQRHDASAKDERAASSSKNRCLAAMVPAVPAIAETEASP